MLPQLTHEASEPFRMQPMKLNELWWDVKLNKFYGSDKIMQRPFGTEIRN